MKHQSFYRPEETLQSEPHRYTECGLDNVFLMNGFERETHDGEEYISITDVDGLHAVIGQHIALARKAPTGSELRFLRTEMDMSQADLAKILSVSNQSVARWEKGQTDVPGTAFLSIKVVYLLSLVPEDDRAEVMSRFKSALSDLADKDEVSDRATFSHAGGAWIDQAA